MGVMSKMRLVASGSALLAALLLAGCAADSRSSLPAFLRVKEAPLPAPEPAPDVPLLVRKNLETIFVASSLPRDLEASPARRNAPGDPWTACVRAEITSAAGQRLRRQTYRLTISQGEIIDRRRVAAGDCVSESYSPILPTK